MKLIVFRHLPEEGYQSAFETYHDPRHKLSPEMVIPGLGRANDIYIRHFNFLHRGETILLSTRTYEEPTGEEIDIVIGEARKMLDGRY
ncbi:MAG: hypothetical protein AAFQ14_09790 [Cyanobacteria bacterium J06621_12]